MVRKADSKVPTFEHHACMYAAWPEGSVLTTVRANFVPWRQLSWAPTLAYANFSVPTWARKTVQKNCTEMNLWKNVAQPMYHWLKLTH
jgi:hypothetical protein